MERVFANQFQELTQVDLTTVYHELQPMKDECDNFLNNLHRAGAIDDSMLSCDWFKRTRTKLSQVL